MKKYLFHSVHIRFKPDTPQTLKSRVFGLYQTLGEECGGREAGILHWSVKWNLDMRKGVELVEFVIFRDDAALQAFRKHPNHQEIFTIMRDNADWTVGDTIEEFPFDL